MKHKTMIAEFEAIIEREANSLAFMLLGHAYRGLEQFESAIKAYQKAIDCYQQAQQKEYILAEQSIDECKEQLLLQQATVLPLTINQSVSPSQLIIAHSSIFNSINLNVTSGETLDESSTLKAIDGDKNLANLDREAKP